MSAVAQAAAKAAEAAKEAEKAESEAAKVYEIVEEDDEFEEFEDEGWMDRKDEQEEKHSTPKDCGYPISNSSIREISCYSHCDCSRYEEK